MHRRDFLLRSAGLLGGLALARRALAQAGDVAPVPAAAYDTLRTTLPVAPDSSSAAGEAVVSLAVGGDTTPGYNLEAHFDEQIAAGVDRTALWPLYFAGIRPVLDAADLAIVNLECTLTERGVKLPKNFNFRARPELVQILREGSVDIVTLANNHMSDYGPEGVDDTRLVLDAAGIRHFGAGPTLAEARQPLIVERNGLRLGFLGYYFQAGRDMIEPRAVYASAKRHGVAGCYKSLGCMRAMVREDVEKLVPQVDLAIPYFHWGWEGHYEVRDYQIELAHLCVDLGCRAVFGCHPHRLQGIEVYRGAPVFYSLGNFVYGGNKDPQDKLSAIARVRLSKSSVEADVVPIQITRWPEAPFQPFVLEGEEQAKGLARIAELSAGFPATLPALAAAR